MSVWVPDATVVNALLGSDSQVVTPLKILMYLYWIAVLAGRLTVTKRMRESDRGLGLMISRLTSPDGVGGRRHDQSAGGGPVFESVNGSRDVNVL